MIKQDYLLRMINQLIEGMLRCLFKIKKDDNEEVIYKNSEDEEKYKKLINLVDCGKINEAENKLFKEINYKNIDYFKVALMFYSYINEKDDDFLLVNNYSRKEIAQGIEDLCKKYNVYGLAEPFIKMM